MGLRQALAEQTKTIFMNLKGAPRPIIKGCRHLVCKVSLAAIDQDYPGEEEGPADNLNRCDGLSEKDVSVDCPEERAGGEHQEGPDSPNPAERKEEEDDGETGGLSPRPPVTSSPHRCYFGVNAANKLFCPLWMSRRTLSRSLAFSTF